MTNLKDMTAAELSGFLETLGEKKFRGKQIYHQMYNGAASFEEMSDLPAALREKLSGMEKMGEISLNSMEVARVQASATDGTRKYLFRLNDGNKIESVFMKYSYGNSICVSSQAGCRMGCRFCASTIGGLCRNLTPGEIIDQILSVQRDTGERINHVVVMGTGEPFDNYENLSAFIRLANSKEGLALGMRNITVSTCGLVPRIRQFAQDFPQVNLAVSLHAPNDEIRSSMMPVNDSYDMSVLLPACREYTKATNRRITFEYALVSGVNDSMQRADELAGVLRGMLCHVNLIPLNKVTESGLTGSTRPEAKKFMERLEKHGIPATIRRELGSDIDAACGQLRLGRE